MVTSGLVVLDAIIADMEHWDRNAKAAHVRDAIIDRSASALCRLFNQEDMPNEKKCDGCPIRRKTGQQFCQGSPIGQAAVTHFQLSVFGDDAEKTGLKQFRKDCNAVFFFLDSLEY